MKARTLGPLLMIVFGALMVGGALADPIDVGTVTTTTEPCGVLGNVDPCETTTTDPCGPMVGLVNPCETTTTLDPCSPAPAIVANPCPTVTTAPTETTAVGEESTTTAPGEVEGGGVETTDPPAAQPAVNGGELARTGSTDGPLVATGLALVLGGLALALIGRRHRLADQA